jgi:hypothetical protein|nr:MAG TPA: SOS-response transcriptional repressor [Caudoviricetes sp.]
MITRIESLRDYFGLSTRAFALKCGLNQPSLDRMLKGINALNINCISAILATFPDVSAEWLLRGEGDMFKSQSRETERINTLLDTITTLQEAINAKSETIAILNERIHQLENQLKNKS